MIEPTLVLGTFLIGLALSVIVLLSYALGYHQATATSRSTVETLRLQLAESKALERLTSTVSDMNRSTSALTEQIKTMDETTGRMVATTSKLLVQLQADPASRVGRGERTSMTVPGGPPTRLDLPT